MIYVNPFWVKNSGNNQKDSQILSDEIAKWLNSLKSLDKVFYVNTAWAECIIIIAKEL